MDYVCPFELRIDPMQLLALVDIEHDEYASLEFQHFDDAVHGVGVVVLIYRVDGKVDVIRTPGLCIDRQSVDIGEGLGDWREAPDLQWSLSDLDGPIRLAVRFEDRKGREIRWELSESDPRVPPMQILAPVGASMAAPRFFPFYFLHELRLVAQQATCTVTLAGRDITVSKIPMPAKGRRVFVARVAPRPLIAQINPESEGSLARIEADAAGVVQRGPARWRLAAHDGGLALVELTRTDGRHTIALRFDPPCPDVRRLDDGEEFVGAFAFGTEVTEHAVRGELRIRRSDDGVTLLMQAEHSWWPDSLSDTLIIGLFPPSFRSWVRTYRFCCEMRLDGDGVTARGSWERTPKARWGARPRTVHVVRELPAPPQTVFAALTCPEQIAALPGVSAVEILASGQPVPEGTGHRREVVVEGNRYTEEITGWEPPHRFEYRIRESSAPIDHEHGHVVLTPTDEGTRVEWVAIFRMNMSVGGGMVGRWGQARMERTLQRQLDAIASRLAPAG